MTVRSTRHSKAQSIIETVVGIMFLVPIVLFLFDIAVIVLANTANDNLAKSACRAAASAINPATNAGDAASAAAAATATCKTFTVSNLIMPSDGSTDSTKFLSGFFFNSTVNPGTSSLPANAGVPLPGQVGVCTTMLVKYPMPFPGFENATFSALDIEPIVSIAP